MSATALAPFETSGAALRHQAALRPAAEALAFPLSGGRRSFAAWLAESESLARGLLALGLAPRAHVALLAENRLEWPVAQLAIALAGMVMVPLNSHYRHDDLAFALAQSDSQALLLSRSFRSNPYLEMVEALRPKLPQLAHVVCFDGASGTAMGYDALLKRGRMTEGALPAVRAGDIAALLYTSGTTGFPKGALLTHGAMLANAWGTSERFGVVAGDRWTSIIPLFHCAGCILNILGPLQHGAAYVGVPAFDPVTMFEIIESERCTLALRRADLLCRHARSSRARPLRPRLAEGRQLRRRRCRSGDPATLRGRVSHAAAGAGLWPDGIGHPHHLPGIRR